MVAVILLILFAGVVTAYAGDNKPPLIQKISPQVAYSMIHNPGYENKFVIIDVRTPGEYQTGHIPNAVNIDFLAAAFGQNINALDKGKIYFVYCQGGFRSAKAVGKMAELGFLEVYDMGGIVEWKAAGFEIVTDMQK
jgi:rhodanese-related sulfurtransferase